MPNPLDYVIPGLDVVSGVANAFMQAGVNRRNREFTEHMYGVQRADALADWNRQNEYNSPIAQMTRLKEAGLNPNLVYGNGGASAVSQSMPRQASVSGGQASAPQLQFNPNSFMAAQDLEIKRVQTDNLKKMREQMDSNIALNAIKAGEISAKTAKTKQEYDQALLLRRGSLEAQELMLQKMKFDLFYGGQKNDRENLQTDLSMMLGIQGNDRADRALAHKMFMDLEANQRADVRQANDLWVAAEKVFTMRAQRAGLPMERSRQILTNEAIKKDNELRELNLQWRKAGVTDKDNLLYRFMVRLHEISFGD